MRGTAKTSAMEAATASYSDGPGGFKNLPGFSSYYFSLAGRTLRVRTHDAWACELLASTYAPMRCAPSEDAEDVLISPGGDFAGAFYVLRDLFARFAAQAEDCVALYAASVAINGRAVLFLGPATIGKSVLGLNLRRYGARFLGDELALLNLRDGTVGAVPRTAALREPGLPYLLDGGLRARISACNRALFTQRGRLWYALNEDVIGAPIDSQSYPLGAIYAIAAREPRSRIAPLASASVMTLLSRRMHRLPQTLEQIGMLHQLARSVSAYELTIGTPQETASTVLEGLQQCV